MLLCFRTLSDFISLSRPPTRWTVTICHILPLWDTVFGDTAEAFYGSPSDAACLTLPLWSHQGKVLGKNKMLFPVLLIKGTSTDTGPRVVWRVVLGGRCSASFSRVPPLYLSHRFKASPTHNSHQTRHSLRANLLP